MEDDDHIVAIVRDGLTRMGYRVEGPVAVATVEAQPCDLVVLDLLLHGMDGVEVCRWLRARGGPPVIMLTARDAVAEKIGGWTAGRTDVLRQHTATRLGEGHALLPDERGLPDVARRRWRPGTDPHW